MDIFGNIRQWNSKRKTQKALNKLPDALLSDIGYMRDGKKLQRGTNK
ncbi:MAG: DUF1127 domain-containing protein [Hyphomicrobiales bacterium]